jgi:hypothetical protein
VTLWKIHSITATRTKIPRPWLDRVRTPLTFKEQKPEIIWEDDWELDSPPPPRAPPTFLAAAMVVLT